MRGHITKKGARYYFVVDVGKDPESGKRKQKWHGGFRTRKEAEVQLSKTLNDLQQNTYVQPSKQTVAEFVEEWLPAIKSTVRESTWDSYRSNLAAHVIPRLGGTHLNRLAAPRLNAMYQALLESGRRDGKGGLSPRTVRYVHTILHRVLRDAVRWGKIARNPADQADPPRQSRPDMAVWSQQELRAFLSHVEDDRLYPLFLLVATTGMRRGELLGLRWEDVDLDGARLQVRQTLVVVNYRPTFSKPKTARSKRSISLDPVTVSTLRMWRATQMQEKLAWGSAYQGSGLVFTQENGALVHPQSISDLFERRARGARLPTIRFHDLRHTYATVALSAGAHPKVVADRLGHASISITLDTYSHVLASVGEEEAAAVALMILEGPVST